MFKVTVFMNGDSNFMDGWKEGQRLFSFIELEVEAPDIPVALDRVFNRLNADDRPFGRCVRSMSVGDVVLIGRVLGAVALFERPDVSKLDCQTWTVESQGWRRLETFPADVLVPFRLRIGGKNG